MSCVSCPPRKFVDRGFDVVMQQRLGACTPVIDGVVIPYAQGNMLLRGDAMQIPILLGTTVDEGSGGGPGYVERVTERLGISSEPYTDGMDGMRRLARDYWQARHYAWARIRSEDLKLPTWHYVFSRADGERGAQHGDEIPYIFRTLGSFRHPMRANDYSEDDFKFADVISRYWENFIRTGDPNGEGLKLWPKKEAGVGHMTLDIEYGMTDSDYLHENDPEIFAAAYAWLKRRAAGEIDG